MAPMAAIPDANANPARPPSIGEHVPEPAQNLLGGAGAGTQASSDNTTSGTDRGRDLHPVPSSSAADPSPSVSASPSREAPTTTEPTTAPTTDPATSEPPSETTSEPTTDPSDATEPPTGDETDAPDGQPSDEGGNDDWWTDENPGPHGDYSNYASSEGR